MPVFPVGSRLLGSTKGYSGFVLFASKCSPCTQRQTAALLINRAVRERDLLVVTRDASKEWVLPSGYERAKTIVDASPWQSGELERHLAPTLLRCQSGIVQEVLQ
jgi:hypothetical protein